MNRVRKNKRFLQLLAEAKTKKQREDILRHANISHLTAIREICLNLCLGNLRLPSEHKKKLKRFATVIRHLGDRKTKLSEKKLKSVLTQRGGFLGLLIPAVLSLVSAIGGRAISKAIGI